ncbi:hypothetical protein BDR26DRAFT_865927 [Obelidium mucronatum]|nr:hypothetical protein BDR26DRAFT_865927 [Obelidium mucronatum]
MPLRAITGSSSVSKACAALVQVLSMPPEGFDLSVKILPGSWVEADDRFVSPNRDYLKRSAMSTPAPTSAASPAYSDEEESIHDDSVSAVPPKKKQRKNSATPSLLTVSSTANSRRASVDSLGDVAPNCSRHSSPDDSLLEDSSIASAATSTAKQGFKKQNMYAPSAMPSLPSRRAAKTVLHVNTDEESDGYQSGANNTSSETENSNPKHPSHGKLNASRSKTVFVLPAGVSPAKPGVCHFCKSNKTGQWRRGPGGMRTLCNACGINWCRKVRAYARNKNMSVEAAERAVGADEAWFRRTCV